VVARWRLPPTDMGGHPVEFCVGLRIHSPCISLPNAPRCVLHYLGHLKYPPHGTAEVRNPVWRLPWGDCGHPNPQRRDTFIVSFAFQSHSMEVDAFMQTLGYEEVQVRLAGEVGNRSPRMHYDLFENNEMSWQRGEALRKEQISR